MPTMPFSRAHKMHGAHIKGERRMHKDEEGSPGHPLHRSRYASSWREPCRAVRSQRAAQGMAFACAPFTLYRSMRRHAAAQFDELIRLGKTHKLTRRNSSYIYIGRR